MSRSFPGRETGHDIFSKESIHTESKVGKGLMCLEEWGNALAEGLSVEKDNR